MTPSATVSASAPPPPPPPAAAPPAAPAQPQQQQPDAAAFQRQIDELKQQNAELTRATQYWAEKARDTGAPAKAVEAEDEPDVLETITTRGAKGFDELASKRGFIRKDEVSALINERAATLTKEQELLATYPDLKKKDSEFFKSTALHYGDLVKGGTPQALAMELAAQRTELEFMRSGKLKAPGAEPTKEEKEQARVARINAQSGADGGGRRPAAAEPEDEDLTPEQKHIARAMGISEEAYKKRAQAGVSIKGGFAR